MRFYLNALILLVKLRICHRATECKRTYGHVRISYSRRKREDNGFVRPLLEVHFKVTLCLLTPSQDFTLEAIESLIQMASLISLVEKRLKFSFK